MKRNEIINKIYFHEGGLFECIPENDRCWDMQSKVYDLADELSKKLAAYPEFNELFMKYDEIKTELACERNDYYYAEGFRMGVLLGIDVSDIQEEKT